ncbi:MAG: methyltransferase domain-containing protein [Ilumatobacteraceae bacterium]
MNTPPTLQHERYTRSNGYDPAWVTANQMGPNALWLTESLTEIMTIEPGMKVLDLGCGRAMSSIFLAREFGASAWATDLWIPASENQQRIVEAGVADLVTPIHAEAHTLPFAADFFDAIVSLDAYQYFGTDDLYLGYLLDFLKPERQLGIVVPGTTRELGAEIPATLEPFWEWDFCCWHSPDWWRTHWAKTGKVGVDHADLMEDGWRDWLRFNDFITPHVTGWWVDEVAVTHDMLLADHGTEFGFARVLATKLERPTRGAPTRG